MYNFIHNQFLFYRLNKIHFITYFIIMLTNFGSITNEELSLNTKLNTINETFLLNSINVKLKSDTNTTASYRNWPVLSLSIFSLFGIFGNVLVCMTIRRDQSLQTKTNYYLFSLAIADMAVCIIVIPFSIIQDFLGKLF